MWFCSHHLPNISNQNQAIICCATKGRSLIFISCVIIFYDNCFQSSVRFNCFYCTYKSKCDSQKWLEWNSNVGGQERITHVDLWVPSVAFLELDVFSSSCLPALGMNVQRLLFKLSLFSSHFNFPKLTQIVIYMQTLWHFMRTLFFCLPWVTCKNVRCLVWVWCFWCSCECE